MKRSIHIEIVRLTHPQILKKIVDFFDCFSHLLESHVEQNSHCFDLLFSYRRKNVNLSFKLYLSADVEHFFQS